MKQAADRQSPLALSRRELLAGGAGAAGLFALGPLASRAAPVVRSIAAASLFAVPASDFAEPALRRSLNGSLKTQLRVAYARNRLGATPVTLRAYEGGLTGPTLRFRPGDVVEVDLLNQLPAEAPAHHRNGPHGLNTTNLHTHGLHVSPLGNSDNVLLEIPPGERLRYRFEIPKDHPAGVFYYHAHKHGSTAVQLGSGMAGALIVEGGVDRLPEIRAAAERLLVLQQFPISRKGTVEWKDVVFDDPHVPTLVNGRLKPRLPLRPGEVQRWRFLHAGPREALRLSLADAAGRPVPLHRIAVDGLTTGRREPTSALDLGPGNRTDVLVQLPAAGTYYLLKSEVRPGHGDGPAAAAQVLAEVAVGGPPLKMALPTDAALRPLAPFATLATAARVGHQSAELSVEGTAYRVDGRPFDAGNPPRRLKLGTVDEWKVSAGAGSSLIHPFHIHVNPFEVLAINGRRLGHPLWMDTILIGGAGSGYPTREVLFRTRYRDFTGRFMLHCHNAVHEDMGMMELVEIVR